MKLSKAQQELLAAMKRGVVVHYMSGLHAYYFRNDTMRNCSVTVLALIKRGLVKHGDTVSLAPQQ